MVTILGFLYILLRITPSPGAVTITDWIFVICFFSIHDQKYCLSGLVLNPANCEYNSRESYTLCVCFNEVDAGKEYRSPG